ncbi:MAG: hypothetical protein KJ709_05645 [Nanoarchaeota archaeon]|nr:hypothetical protein [Nanoarchaeota archaeon]
MKKRQIMVVLFASLILCLSCLPTVLSADKSGVTESFSSDFGIVPPPIPGADPLSEITPFSKPLTVPEVIFTLKDIDTRSDIMNIHVNVELIHPDGHTSRTLMYIEESGLSLDLEPGTYTMILKVDELGTMGNDYYLKSDRKVETDMAKTIFLFPVGSVRGVVYQDSRAVEGALLKFDCSGSYGETGQRATDSYGSFYADWLPVGSCKVSAIYQGNVGHEQVTIEKGQLHDIEIDLSRKMLTSGYQKAILAIVILAAIIVIIMMLQGRGLIGKLQNKAKTAKKLETALEEEKKKEKKVIKENIRQNDIIKTLNTKEKSIVNHLLESGPETTQAKITYATSIPKTSLARILQNLEQKKILIVTKFGKAKKVNLTQWFLGNE